MAELKRKDAKPFVFGIVALATLIGAATAHAVCKSPKNICKQVDNCLQRTFDPNNKHAESIRAGVKARNGTIVKAAAEACARDLGRKKNGITGPVGAQMANMSQSLGQKWNSEESIAIGIHNNEVCCASRLRKRDLGGT